MSLVLSLQENQIIRIILNRPEKLNAFNEELVEELMDVFLKATSSEARLVVFQAAGKGFSGGFDLSDIGQLSDGDLVLRLIRVEQLLQAVYYAPVATLAFVHGSCYGAAAELVASCQWRVATPQAQFRMPGPKFGLALGSRRLVDLVGEKAFRSLVLREDPVASQEALDLGYLNKIVEDTVWKDVESKILAQVNAVDATTFSRLLSQQRRDLRDGDLAELVRSAADGSIKSRILSYLRQVALAKASKNYS